MKHHRFRILLGCLGLIAVAYFAPNLGLAGSTTSVIVIVLMVGCCVSPLIIGMRGGRARSCHDSNMTAKANENAALPKTDPSTRGA